MSSAPISALARRILSRLEAAEANEQNPHLQDDYRIAWITVLYAARGDPSPHFWATYKVLRMPPNQVWPSIVARRRAMCGKSYAYFFPTDSGVSLPPKKSAASERVSKKSRAAA